VSRRLRLRELKSRYMAKLLDLRKQLLEKYSDKREKVEFVVDRLMGKLQLLKARWMPDYIYTVYQYAKEFPELEALIPSEEEIREIEKESEEE
jgi:hypothetical protein